MFCVLIFFYHSHHVAVGLVGTMAHACLFTKRTAMSASATKDSQEHTAKWVRAFKRGLSSSRVSSRSKGTSSSRRYRSSSSRECT